MVVDDFLSECADRFPNKIACKTQTISVTYQELNTRVNQLTAFLVENGVRRWERVAVFLENRLETVISIFAILRAGGVFVVINPTTKEDKLLYMLNDCGATALITDFSCHSTIQAIDQQADSVRFAICTGTKIDVLLDSINIYEWDAVFNSTSMIVPTQRCIDMDPAAIIYTSGSTGFPKGVTVTHLNIISAATSITEYLDNSPEDIILNTLPLSFDYGLYQVLMSVKVGATLILEKSFVFAYEIVQIIRQEKVTGFPGVPTIFALLLQLKNLDTSYFDSIRYISNTGAALSPTYIQKLKGLFPKSRIYCMYGLTECKRVSYLPPEDLDLKMGSVGRGMPNEEVYIVDENGDRVGPEVVGELVVRGSNVMQGYWGKPEETHRVLKPGLFPWERVLKTGDLFRMDSEGYLYFVARKDDMIKCRGEKVSPVEVENVILEIPDVEETVVTGVPDDILGEAIRAFIVRKMESNLSREDVIRHCTRRLENYMIPKFIEFCESLPISENGKIQRKNLKTVINNEINAVA